MCPPFATTRKTPLKKTALNMKQTWKASKDTRAEINTGIRHRNDKRIHSRRKYNSKRKTEEIFPHMFHAKDNIILMREHFECEMIKCE